MGSWWEVFLEQWEAIEKTLEVLGIMVEGAEKVGEGSWGTEECWEVDGN